MYFMESRQKEDEEVSSQATTLQFGSPGKSRWEEYVCRGYPHCENFDCDLCDNPSETEGEDYMDWHAKEDEMLNTAPFGTGQYLRNEVRKYHLRRKRKEANDRKLGLCKGRSGGRAAPKKIRKAKEKEKGKEAEPCTCENCMSQETYDLYIKEGFEKAKEKEKAKDKKRDKDKAMGKGKESSAVADKGQHELKRETAKETHTRPSEWLTQKRWDACGGRTESPTSSVHKDGGVPCFVRTHSPTSSLITQRRWGTMHPAYETDWLL